MSLIKESRVVCVLVSGMNSPRLEKEKQKGRSRNAQDGFRDELMENFDQMANAFLVNPGVLSRMHRRTHLQDILSMEWEARPRHSRRNSTFGTWEEKGRRYPYKGCEIGNIWPARWVDQTGPVDVELSGLVTGEVVSKHGALSDRQWV